MQLLRQLEEINSESACLDAKRDEITKQLKPLAKAQHTLMRETYMRVFPEDTDVSYYFTDPRWIHFTSWVTVNNEGKGECWERGYMGNQDELIHTFDIVEISDPNAYAAGQIALWELEKQRRAGARIAARAKERADLQAKLDAMPKDEA